MPDIKQNVLVLHGWKLTSDKYHDLRNELNSKGYKVLIPDMPGNGIESEPEKPYKLDDYVNFVSKYLSQKNIKECIVICHSFGGRVGIKLAAQNPELVKGLILTGVPGFRSVSWLKRISFMILAKLGRIISMGHNTQKILYTLSGTHDYRKTTGVMRETFKNIVSENLTEPMRKLNCPVLLIWGENDKIVPLKIAKQMQKTIDNSRLIVIPDTRHNLPYKEPALFINHLAI